MGIPVGKFFFEPPQDFHDHQQQQHHSLQLHILAATWRSISLPVVIVVVMRIITIIQHRGHRHGHHHQSALRVSLSKTQRHYHHHIATPFTAIAILATMISFFDCYQTHSSQNEHLRGTALVGNFEKTNLAQSASGEALQWRCGVWRSI